MTDQERFEQEIEEYGLEHYDMDALEAYWADWDDMQCFEDRYLGTFDAHGEHEAIGEYLEQTYEDCGLLEDLPQAIRHHVDWQGMGRDARMGGEMYAEEGDIGRWHVFSNM